MDACLTRRWPTGLGLPSRQCSANLPCAGRQAMTRPRCCRIAASLARRRRRRRIRRCRRRRRVGARPRCCVGRRAARGGQRARVQRRRRGQPHRLRVEWAHLHGARALSVRLQGPQGWRRLRADRRRCCRPRIARRGRSHGAAQLANNSKTPFRETASQAGAAGGLG